MLKNIYPPFYDKPLNNVSLCGKKTLVSAHHYVNFAYI